MKWEAISKEEATAQMPTERRGRPSDMKDMFCLMEQGKVIKYPLEGSTRLKVANRFLQHGKRNFHKVTCRIDITGEFLLISLKEGKA